MLAFLGGAVGLISVLLLGIDGGPPFSGDTSLYEFFGYFGLFCSTVLVLRVLVAVLRDGTTWIESTTNSGGGGSLRLLSRVRCRRNRARGEERKNDR